MIHIYQELYVRHYFRISIINYSRQWSSLFLTNDLDINRLSRGITAIRSHFSKSIRSDHVAYRVSYLSWKRRVYTSVNVTFLSVRATCYSLRNEIRFISVVNNGWQRSSSFAQQYLSSSSDSRAIKCVSLSLSLPFLVARVTRVWQHEWKYESS